MNKHELHALRARFWDAKVNNFKVGGAGSHVEELQKLAGPLKGDGSVDHLIELVDQALKGKPVSHPEVKKAAPPPAPKPAPKMEAKPAPKAEVKKEEPKPEPPTEKPVEEDEIDFDNF